jgi:hypothetical protein
VTISGPSTLQVGEAGTYTITLSGNSKTGPNVAASDGTLGKVTTQFSVSGGELTFSSARNSDTWQFTYTPTSAGTKTLYATGVINGRPGTWNHAADFTLDATTTKTSVETDVPVTFVLDQNYPNPFNPSTTIHYSTAKTTRVVLTVTDATGKLVATLVDAVQPTGSYQATFDGSRFASGIYFYRLQAPIESGQAGDFVATRKMLMLK